MERLRAADAKDTVEKSLTDAQKTAIAEVRKLAAARAAEREILFQDALKGMRDPAEREKAQEEYRIDRDRIQADCDRAVEKIRQEEG